MTGALAFLGFIVAQRLAELWLSRRNTRALLAKGAREHAPGHYLLIVGLHIGWIAALCIWGWNNALSLPWLAVFVLLQLFRVWVLATLGPRWTTRIIVTEGPLVQHGPFRLMRHPNYALVVAEIAVAPLVLGLPMIALIFSALNLCVLAIRIRAENAALHDLRN